MLKNKKIQTAQYLSQRRILLDCTAKKNDLNGLLLTALD
jgi:hypothetical protein